MREFHGALLFNPRHALIPRDTQPELDPFVNCSPAVGTNAAIAIQEGFGTLSRQLGNDEGYRSSRVGVSGCFTCWLLYLLATSPMVPQLAAAAAVERAKGARNRMLRHRPRLRRMGGLRTAF